MNLFDMAVRKDSNLRLVADYVPINRIGATVKNVENENGSGDWSTKISLSKRKYNGSTYRGFDLSASHKAKIILNNPLSFHPFRERCEATGWRVVALDSIAENAVFRAELVDKYSGEVLALTTQKLSNKLTPIDFPYSFAYKSPPNDCDLHMSAGTESKGKLFFAVHKALDRSEVLSLCKGTGVEIGPGLHPQIKSSNSVKVIYLEQSEPEQWNSLYNEKGTRTVDRNLWINYRIGEASNLPFDDQSLDFIFSSHVFEHLANPVGHLQQWKMKLKPNGVVVGIVPDIAGCKDYVHGPCPLSDLIVEYDMRIMSPTLSHYERWAKFRAPGKDPREFMEAGRSIHVHFYSHNNMSSLLQYCVERIGFKWFNIRYTPNHKDFYFILAA